MHSPLIIGQSDRIIVREWQPSDADEWYRLSQDAGLNRFTIAGYRQESVEASHDFIRLWKSEFSKSGLCVFPVVSIETSEILGLCGLKVARFDGENEDVVEIMYRFAERNWNMGYATEAAKALLNYAFSGLQLSKVIGFIEPENEPSRKVLLRIGMKYLKKTRFKGIEVEVYRVELVQGMH